MEIAIIVALYFSLNLLGTMMIIKEARKGGFDYKFEFKTWTPFLAFTFTVGLFLPLILAYAWLTEPDEDDE